MSIPTITLNNGVEIPALGFGVYQSAPEETVSAVATALEAGYRHIDTAAAYGNEREVGQAIRDSGLAREEVFIETKIWITDYGYDQTLHAFEKAVGKLGVERSVNDPDRVVLVLVAPRTEHHRAQAQRADGHSGTSELAAFHGQDPSFIGFIGLGAHGGSLPTGSGVHARHRCPLSGRSCESPVRQGLPASTDPT